MIKTILLLYFKLLLIEFNSFYLSNILIINLVSVLFSTMTVVIFGMFGVDKNKTKLSSEKELFILDQASFDEVTKI